MLEQDKTIENLLELNGVKYIVDEHLGLWVKFEVKLVKPSHDRPHGIRYSLSLHDRFNKRIMGFDNAHAVTSKRVYDHWHRNEFDNGRPYDYKNAGQLLEDFWKEVDKLHDKYYLFYSISIALYIFAILLLVVSIIKTIL